MAVETETQLEAWMAENIPSEPNLQTKTGIQIMQNGQFSFEPDAGYDGLASVSGEVDVQGNPNYIETWTGILGTILDYGNPKNWDLIDFIDYIEYTIGGLDNVSVWLTVTLATVGTYKMPLATLDSDNYLLVFSNAYQRLTHGTHYGGSVVFTTDSGVQGVLYQDSSNIGWDVDDNIPCTLTIIHHPLPSSST